MAIDITITVPDLYVTPILESFNSVAGSRLSFEFESEEQRGRWEFTIDPKGVGETNLEFAKRVNVELIRSLVRCVDYAEDVQRYRSEISAISPPTQDVPDEIVS